MAIAVVDRFGEPLVVLRDRFAGPHTVATAMRKAWTSVSFRTSTLELSELIEAPGSIMAGIRQIPNALPLGGGVPVRAAGILVGAIGISGAPGPDLDEACADTAIETIQDLLDF